MRTAPDPAETCRNGASVETKMRSSSGRADDHDVPMQLHEDLILTQRIDRAKEGSF